jgi:3-methylfumaryl-CoA hydratase
MTDLHDYVGRTETQRDIADPERMHRLAATLDHDVSPWSPGVLPPLGHWLCFRPDARQSLLGPDGHPARTDDGFLPNVDLPRRMWAGSRVRFLRDIALGAALTRTSTIKSVLPKQGRSGSMLFVTVTHSVSAEGDEPAILEEQDIVYREAAAPGGGTAAEAANAEHIIAPEAVTRALVPCPVMLFRYSALTFNSHRIHYDRNYAQNDEGYPGLVVHGPLIATLLMDHFLRQRLPDKVVAYDFKAVSPSFEGNKLTLTSVRRDDQVQLEAVGPRGVGMAATITLAS